MLRNRFLRLLTTILMGVGLLLIAFWGEKALVNGGSQIPDATLIGAVLITFAVCIIGQFFGDIMNVDACFNCGLFTFLKRLVFFAVVLLALFVGLSLAISYGGVADLLEEGASFFDVVLCSAVAYAPAFALLFYVLEYTVFSSPKVRMPFYFPLAYGAALALGVVSTLIVTFAELQEESIFIVLGLSSLLPSCCAFAKIGPLKNTVAIRTAVRIVRTAVRTVGRPVVRTAVLLIQVAMTIRRRIKEVVRVASILILLENP